MAGFLDGVDCEVATVVVLGDRFRVVEVEVVPLAPGELDCVAFATFEVMD